MQHNDFKMYQCMTCNKVYKENELPTIGNGDGCCSIGSLIEVDGYTVKRKVRKVHPVIIKPN